MSDVAPGALLALVFTAGCLGGDPPSSNADAGGSDFAVVRATSNITVFGPSVDREAACGRPVDPYARIDLANRTVAVVRHADSLKGAGPAYLLYEDLQIVDIPEPCSRLSWLFPLLDADTRLVLGLHDHDFSLNMTRDVEGVRWEGWPVDQGDTVERAVSFQRHLGGRTYQYEGSIRFTFLGVWDLADVTEVDREPDLPESGDTPFWHYAKSPTRLHRED